MRLFNLGLTAVTVVISVGCFAQTMKFAPSQFSPKGPADIQVSDGYVYARGRWEAMPDSKDKPAGPSISEITCDKAEGKCKDVQANLAGSATEFSITSAVDEYTIERWNNKEIVASNVAGLCHVRNALKIDLVAKRVFILQTLSEPIPQDMPEMSRKMCEAVGMSLELKQPAMWTIVPEKDKSAK